MIALQVLRCLMVVVAILLVVPLSRIIILWIHSAFQLRIRAPIIVITTTATIVAGVAMGLQIARRWHRSIIDTWVRLPDRMSQPFWIRGWGVVRRTFSSDPLVLFMLAGLLLTAFVFRWVFLPGQHPWRVPGLGVSLALLLWVTCSVPGFLVGICLYGGWIRPCAQSVKAKQRR